MTVKFAGQRGFLCRTTGPTRGEIKRILPHARRVGALPGKEVGSRRTVFGRRPNRLIAVFVLAAMSCVGYAQEDSATSDTKSGAAVESPTAAKSESSESDSSESGSTEAAPDKAPSPDGVTVVASNLPIERVLGQLSDQAGVKVSARGKTAGTKVTLIQPRPIPLADALNQLANSQPNWLVYEPPDRPGTFELWDQETYKAEVLPRLVRPKVFLPKEITAEDAAKALEGVMTPGIGKIAFDNRSNKVIMTDLVPVLELAQRLLETIDVKFITRVYSIEHADVNDVAEKLSALKSPAAPDIQVDERTRQIVVSDRIDVLQKMEQLVETLDIGPEMRVYTINNLGVEGEELDELEEAIEEILTPDAYYHFNIRQGKLIVRDLPEVQERVEKVLSAFDAPVRQILLQLEIIETEFSDGFNWQVDYAFSGDLLGAVTDGLVSGVPSGGSTDADGKVVSGTEGFVNFRKEFPVLKAGSTGIDASYLSRHAFVKLAAAMSDSRTRVLQQPRLLVENQKLASFDVGQSVPFFSGGSIGYNSSNGNNNTLTPSQPVQQLLQVGLYVEVTPIISASGLVELELTVENSSPLRVEQTFAGQSYTGVGKTNQELITTMWVPSGATRVVGGLVTDSKSETRTGIPGLYKIPIIGPALFGSYTKDPESNRRRNLLIFITPTIVEEKPTDMHKYKGVLMSDLPQDELTTPPATLTDLPTGRALSNLPQLEKGDYLSYTPPPLPDFKAMSQSMSSDGNVLLSPKSEDLKATVNLKDTPNGDVIAPPDLGPSSMTTLPRVSLSDGTSTDSLHSLVTTSGPSGAASGSVDLTGGEFNKSAKPPTNAASPATNQAGNPAATAAAAAAQRNTSGHSSNRGSRRTHSNRTATPPGRETNHR